MITPTADAGRASGSAPAQVAPGIGRAPKHDVRTTQAISAQAVSRTDAPARTRSHTQPQDAGIQLQISGKQGAKAEQALTRLTQQATVPHASAAAERGTQTTRAGEVAVDPAATNSLYRDREQIEEVIERLESDERDRRKRALELAQRENNFADTSPGSTPEETIQKARVLRSKASQNDTEGAELATKAAQMEAEAKAKINQRQREAAGLQIDPVDLLERTGNDGRENKTLDRIGSTYGRLSDYGTSPLVSVFA